MPKKYDIIVIGSGGGAKIVSPAARLGLKVACIEKDALGGTCLNRGCIPSKMLIHPADVALQIKEAHRFDIQNDPHFQVNFAKLITRISDTVGADSASIEAGYRRNPNIDFYHSQARFIANKVVEVSGAPLSPSCCPPISEAGQGRYGQEQLTADKIFIAVGTRPQIPQIPGLEDTPFMTSTEALRNTVLPKKMIVIGAGYIAAELAHAYAALGTETHILVRSRLLRREDSQVAEEFTRVFARYHHLYLGAVPQRVDYQKDEFTAIFKDQNQQEKQIQADALLIAAGIVPNTDTLGLENTDIQLSENGFIKVDDRLRTTVPGVYSLGDCIGNYFYRHSVNFEGEYLFRTLFAKPSDELILYPPIPHAIFTHPQVAGVGKTEDRLKEEGADYVVGLNPYAKSAMGMALLSDHGFCKILIDRKDHKILGAHIVGEEASDMIHMLIAFMNKQGTLEDLLNMVYIHPALPEIVRNAARKAKEELEKE